MSTSQGFAGWARVALLALVIAAPGALLGARLLCPEVRPSVRLDIDGDGRADRVELVRHGDDQWIDAAVADAGGWRLVSTTRVAVADGARWSVAVELASPGRDPRLRVRDGRGRVTSWRRDGLAFVRDSL